MNKQIAFFVVVYMSPFLALFAAEAYMVTAFPAVSFLSLLTVALIIVGAHTSIVLGYRFNQQRIQKWRISRAVKQQALNVRTASKPSVPSSS